MSSIAYNNTGSKPLSGSATPTPVTNISANTLVAGTSASIVVMGNIEESHILQQNNSHMDGKPSSHEHDDKEMESNMFNALPAAGVFAIPNNNSNGNLATSKL